MEINSCIKRNPTNDVGRICTYEKKKIENHLGEKKTLRTYENVVKFWPFKNPLLEGTI
jgi:hypothetical protein